MWVKDHNKVSRYVRQVEQGQYFGELALLNFSVRTATVTSSNYCTMAKVDSKVFYKLCDSFPDVFFKMKNKSKDYSDPLKMFKIKLLK